MYPYAADRAYTPAKVTAKDLRRFLDRHGLDRVVIVQPSVYGTDNRAMLDAIAELDGRAKGIAVVDLAKVKDRELADLKAGGVAGLRLNVATRGEGDLARAVRRAERRLKGSRMLIQIYAPLAQIVAARRALAKVEVPVVLDHFGGAKLDMPELDDAADVLVDLARNGSAVLKLSAPYRVVPVKGHEAKRWAGVTPMAEKLLDAPRSKLIWGSDWPHTANHAQRKRRPNAIEPFQAIDDRRSIALLKEWLGDDALLKRVLVDNPARLYRFGRIKKA